MRFDELKDEFGVPTPSVDEIAKKHGVPVALIKRQLKRGQEVEKEHVKVKKLANEIARDHLAEIPDYYTRLDKMEKGAEDAVHEHDVPSKDAMPDQRSTYDQLKDLHQMAIEAKMYDAADWLKLQLDRWFTEINENG